MAGGGTVILSSDVGISVHVGYSKSGSGAFSFDITYALLNTRGYGSAFDFDVRDVDQTLVGAVRTEEQYRGFLTKPGVEYAWGANGEAMTKWVLGNGLPCDLKPPAEGVCELMARECVE